MDLAQWQQAKALLASVAGLAPADRKRFLEANCGDPVLREEIATLLECDTEASLVRIFGRSAQPRRGSLNGFSKRRALWILVQTFVPSPTKWLSLLIGLALLTATIFVVESAFYPWAYSISLGPTLTGGWLGDLMPAIGGRHVVFLQLNAALGESDDDLSGTVWTCNGAGDRHTFGVSGHTGNWRGTKFWLTTYIVERRDGQGVQLVGSDGEWNRVDALHIDAHLHRFWIRDRGVISSTERSREQIALEDTPVALTLKRGVEHDFETACGRLRDGRRGG